MPLLFRLLIFYGIGLGVGLLFSAVGWQTVEIHCQRQQPHDFPNCQIQNGYLNGLFMQAPRQASQVVYVGIEYRQMRSGTSAHSTRVSTLVLTGQQDTEVFPAASNLNRQFKEELKQKIRDYLNSNQQEFYYFARFDNLFGWIGIGVLGLMLWLTVLGIKGRYFD